MSAEVEVDATATSTKDSIPGGMIPAVVSPANVMASAKAAFDSVKSAATTDISYETGDDSTCPKFRVSMRRSLESSDNDGGTDIDEFSDGRRFGEDGSGEAAFAIAKKIELGITVALSAFSTVDILPFFFKGVATSELDERTAFDCLVGIVLAALANCIIITARLV